MPKKSSKSKPPGQIRLRHAGFASLKEFRSTVAKLKRHGLTRADARSVKPTRHMVEKAKALRPVTTGEAHVLTIRSHKLRAKFKAPKGATLRTVGNKLVIPKRAGKETARLTRDGRVILTRMIAGKRERTEILGFANWHAIEVYKRRHPGSRFTLGFRQGREIKTVYFTDPHEIVELLNTSRRLRRARNVLAGYVGVLRV